MNNLLTLPINDYFHLRQTVPDDAEETFALVDKNRDYLLRWMPWVNHTHTAADTREHLESLENDPDTSHEFVLVYHNKIIGRLGMHRVDERNFSTSIGYWLDEDHQGKGLMTMAVQSLLRYIFNTLELNRVALLAGVENSGSRAIAERLGFQYEGIARQAEKHADGFIDLAAYAILREDFR